MKIKRTDTVKILYGKDSGKTGKVLSVNRVKGNVLVEGVNVFKRHVKGDGQTRKSQIVEVIRPMPVSKVKLVCPHCEKPTRIVMKLEGKNYVRVCRKCTKGLDVKVDVKKEVKSDSKVTKKSK